ncbi:5561_t:CDS:10 [Ambispora gerdemannii]|uniref:5561_t:CDS:1 n=1 Tax=Ambispora gerdemannii TaxID=144530 RepID=A0A9N8W1B7_9GLOM|nr:5561_t:CDS:10 [Ambispora gerdemannii]
MSEKRLVDYVFLAGLPQDFHFASIEKTSKTTNVKPTKSQNNKSVSSTPHISGRNVDRSTDNRITTNGDEGNVRVADADTLFEGIADAATLFESIRASIIKFDSERDDFLKSLGRNSARESGGKGNAGIGNESVSKNRTSILPTTGIFRNGSILSTKLRKNLDEGFSETDSFSSSSTLKNNTPVHENSQHRMSYLNVAPQAPTSKGNIPEATEHPLKQKYSPRLLCRYPKEDYSKEEHFPAYIPMFCFPNDIIIRESESVPPTTFHGFVMTQEDGSKRYGVCLTTYEPLLEHLVNEVDILHKEWCTKNMASSKIEYANSLAEKIRFEKERVDLARKKLDSESPVLTIAEREEVEQEKAEAEEKIALYIELLQPIKSGVVDLTKLWMPKCIGVISHLPWHDVLKDWLCAVTMPMIDGLKSKKLEDLPLERYIVNLVHEVPVPPPGKSQVAITVNDMTFFCGRPALNQIPIMNDVALAEGKILLISSYPDMLFLVAHSITYLMYPLSWQGVFIPILPARLMACLQAPVPYIMGIQRQYKGMDLLPEDACIVDLDKDTLMMAQPPPQIPPRQRKKLLQALEAYAPLHSHYATPYGVPLYVQQAYPNGRFTPLCSKSKIFEKNSRITSVIGAPARAVPLAPSMTGFYDMGETGSPKFASADSFPRINSLTGAAGYPMQRRMSSFSGAASVYEGREGSLKSEKGGKVMSISESLKKNKNRSSTLTALNRSSLLVMNRNGPGHAHKLSSDVISLPQTTNSSQYDSESLFSADGWSVMVDPSERIPTEKEFISREGHLMVEIPTEGNPNGQPGMSTWMLEGLACGICQKSLGLNVVFKCEGCSMVAHDDCLSDITHPCIPACFNEAKVQDSFIRVFASLLRNYRAYMPNGNIRNNGNGKSVISETSKDLCEDEFFQKEIFLKNVDREAKPFLSCLMDSQAFSQFIHERLARPADDPEILFFDESITAKLNRSKLKLSKEATRFLDDASYAISETVRAMEPDEEGLDIFAIDSRRSNLPSTFDTRLMYEPRPKQNSRGITALTI